MVYQHMDYSKSSTEALAKEVSEIDYLCESICEISKEHSYIKPQLDGIYDYMVDLRGDVLVVLFDRFTDTFGIKDYFDSNPNRDWLDDEQFLKWYQSLAKATKANESLNCTISITKSWAERLNKSDNE